MLTLGKELTHTDCPKHTHIMLGTYREFCQCYLVISLQLVKTNILHFHMKKLEFREQGYHLF